MSGQQPPVTAYQFTIKYNPTVLEITGATSSGTISAGTSPTVNTTISGQITVAWASATALSGSGVLVKLQANYIGGGSSNLTFSSFDFNEGVPASTTSNGSVTVGSGGGGSVNVSLPTSAGGSVGGGQVLVPVTVGNVSGLNVTSYEFTVTYNAAVVAVAGVSVAGTLSQGSSPSVNKSTAGQVTVTWPGGSALSGSGTLLNLQVNPVGIGTSALAFSNFQFNSGTPTVNLSNGTMTVAANNNPVNVSLPASLSGNAGAAVSIPVSVGDLTNSGVDSYQFTFEFNPALLEVTGVDAGGTLSAGNNAATSSPGAGQLTVTWNRGTDLSGSGTLINIQANLLAAGISAIKLKGFKFNEGQPPAVSTNGNLTVNDPNGAVGVALPEQINAVGATVLIPVLVGEVTGRGISSFEMTVDFDETILKINGVNLAGTITEGTTPIVNLTTAGKVNVAFASVTDLSGSGTLINLEAEVLKEGSSSLVFDTFTFNEGTPAAAVTNGVLTATLGGDGLNISIPTGLWGRVGEVLSIPVKTGDLTGKNVTSYAFTVTYNASQLKITGVNATGTLSEGQTVNAVTSTPGQAVVSLSGGPALSGAGTLIRFQAEMIGPGTSSISFASFKYNSGVPEVTTTNGDILVEGAATYLQVIHNSPDAPAVDIYFNDVKVIDAMSYSGASPFLKLDDIVIKMDVVSDDAENNDNPITSSNLTLVENKDYVAVVNGLYSESGKQAIDLVVEESLQRATDENTVSMLVFHGSPDAPPINVYIVDDNGNRILTLAKGLEFGEAYLSTEFAPQIYNIQITQSNGPVIDEYRADLSRTGGSALLFLVQGFVNPIIGQPELTVMAYAPDGRAIFLPLNTSEEEEAPFVESFQLKGNYPNPFNPTTTIHFDLSEPAEVRVAVYDLLGREVLQLPSQRFLAGTEQSVQLDAGSLASGTYVYRVMAKGARQMYVSSKTMTLLK